MKKYVAVKNDGLPSYIVSIDDPLYFDGAIVNDITIRLAPDYISDIELLNKFYWKNAWFNKPEAPGNYYEWNLETESWIPNLINAKEDKKRLVNRKRDEVLRISNNPLIYNNNTFTNDSRTRINISEALNLINAGVSIPEGFVFRTANNINIPFNADDIKNLAAISLFYKNACYQHSWELKNQIEQLTTVEEIEAFDINVGWP